MPKLSTKYNDDGEPMTPFRSSKEASAPLKDVWLDRVIWVPPLTEGQIGFDEGEEG